MDQENSKTKWENGKNGGKKNKRFITLMQLSLRMAHLYGNLPYNKKISGHLFLPHNLGVKLLSLTICQLAIFS